MVRQAKKSAKAWVVSECPLASDHIRQGLELADGNEAGQKTTAHPIQILARAYGLGPA